jgi:hypothetical protein
MITGRPGVTAAIARLEALVKPPNRGFGKLNCSGLRGRNAERVNFDTNLR